MLRASSNKDSSTEDYSESGTFTSKITEHFGIDIAKFHRDEFPNKMDFEEFIRRWVDNYDVI